MCRMLCSLQVHVPELERRSLISRHWARDGERDGDKPRAQGSRPAGRVGTTSIRWAPVSPDEDREQGGGVTEADGAPGGWGVQEGL